MRAGSAPADHQRGMYRALGGLGCHRHVVVLVAFGALTPLAAAAAARILRALPHLLWSGHAIGGGSCAGDHDVTDVPSIVAGAVSLGLFEAVVVLVFSLVSRLLPNGALETIVLG